MYAVKMFLGVACAFGLLQMVGWQQFLELFLGKGFAEDTGKETAGYVVAEQEITASQLEEPPQVALTFDDGPSAKYTGKLLDGLKARGVKATFFLIGENAEKNPELVKRLDEEGHLIGNHTYHHVQIGKLPEEEAIKEVEETDAVIYQIIGKHTEYMRPPFGEWKKDLEYKMQILPVLWSIDTLDWTTENEDEIMNRVVTDVGEGDIILMHDCYESSVNAALRIVDYLQAEGFELVTADRLVME